MFKNIQHLAQFVITSLLVRDKPLGAPASAKRVYYGHGEERFVHAAYKNYISAILFKSTELYYAGIITLDSTLINTVLATSILLTRRSPEQIGCYLTDDIFKCTPLNEDVLFWLKNLWFVSKGLTSQYPHNFLSFSRCGRNTRNVQLIFVINSSARFGTKSLPESKECYCPRNPSFALYELYCIILFMVNLAELHFCSNLFCEVWSNMRFIKISSKCCLPWMKIFVQLSIWTSSRQAGVPITIQWGYWRGTLYTRLKLGVQNGVIKRKYISGWTSYCVPDQLNCGQFSASAAGHDYENDK